MCDNLTPKKLKNIIKTIDNVRILGYIICALVSTHSYRVLKNQKEWKMDDSRLSARKRQILRAIVDAHIAGGEPVGSKFLSRDVRITCSPATIRNEMAELESMGYLTQPHTSAGRIPTELGYRYYVEALVQQYNETKYEIDEMNERLRYKLSEMDEILSEASRLAASFTDYMGIAFKSAEGKVRVTRFNTVFLSPRDFLLVMTFSGGTVKTKTVRSAIVLDENVLSRFTDAANMYLSNLTSDEITMPIIMKIEALMGSFGVIVHPTIKIIYETMSEMDAADVVLDGATKLLEYPEYSDVSKFRGLLGMLEEKDKLLEVISASEGEDDGVRVYIGKEDGDDIMAGTTLIYKNIRVGAKQVAVGVIGPKRMNYSKVIGMINKLATGMDMMFREELMLPGCDEE